jgi:VCBS repeat-containing protein
MGLESEGIFVTKDGDVFTITVVVAEGGSRTFTTLAGGELTIDSDGSYSYAPPPSGALRDDATESFTYTVIDGDGDTDTATLTIDVTDVIEPAGAFLLTNTNVQEQILRIIVTRDDAEILASEETTRGGEGQQGAVPLGEGVLFEETETYVVAVKFVQDGGTTNITDFDLIFDLDPDLDPRLLDDPDNVFLTLLDQGNIHLGEQGSSHDGAIWQIEGTGDDFTVSPAIVYDVDVRHRRPARKFHARFRAAADRRQRDARRCAVRRR